MNKLAWSLVAVVLSLATVAPPIPAQKRISPHETLSQVFSRKRDDRITVIYGRPYTKDPKTGEMRTIWGKLVPYGKIWRTGADEATLLITQKPLVLGGAAIPAGAYSLYTLPAEDGSAKLIINKELGQWGLTYDKAQDLAQVDLKSDALDTAVDQFTIGIDRTPGANGSGVLRMQWEKTQFSVPFTVQE